jgi:hypothetical protein
MPRMNRYSMAAGLAAVAALAVPTAAQAAGTLVAGPVKAKGYAVTITATDGSSDSMSVNAIKRSGRSLQMHSWSFDGVKVSIKGNKATLKGSLGRYGKIDARVVAGRKAAGTVPAGCTGKPGSARKGKLTGRTKLVLDTTFFKTLAPKSMPAQLLKAGTLDCSGNGGNGGGGTPESGLTLTSSATDAAGTLMVNVAKAGDKVTQTVMRMDAAAASAPASVMHMITGSTGASGLTAAPDLSSASAPATGPFLSGQLAFHGEPMGTMTMGTITGDYAAKFDSIGTQRLPEDNDGMLMAR